MSTSSTNHLATSPLLEHRAFVYFSREALRNTIVPFIDTGLEQREPVLLLPGETTAGALRDVLGSRIDRVALMHPSAPHRVPAWTMAACARYIHAHAERGVRVRIVGEPAWDGRSNQEITEWVRLEALINVAFAGLPLRILCLYHARRLHPDTLAQARRTHPELVTAQGIEPSGDYSDPATVTAECDHEPLPAPPPPLHQHPVTLASLPDIRQLAHREGRRHGLTPDRAEDLTLAINEIANNSIEHGGGSGILTLWIENQWLICEITSPAGHIDDPFPGLLPPRSPTERGHGLWIARQLCELVQIRPRSGGGCTVRLQLDTRPCYRHHVTRPMAQPAPPD